MAAGIPRDTDDLEGWTAYENFMDELDSEQEVSVHVEAYLYGEGETFKATPEGLVRRCHQLGSELDMPLEVCKGFDAERPSGFPEGETFKATPEEVAYFKMRADADEEFLHDHCDNIEDADFTIHWSPDELYGVEYPAHP